MRIKRTSKYLLTLALCQIYTASAQAPSHIVIKQQNNTVTISNYSDKPFDLSRASIEFSYAGKLFNIRNVKNGQPLSFSSRASADNYSKTIYAATLSRDNQNLLPKQTMQLVLQTDNIAKPEHFKLTAAPEPVDVTIKTFNSAWKQTITVCNTSSKSIPLHNVEINFDYSVPMPTVIWGLPWSNWKVASQTDNHVVLIGGTDVSPDLPSDPFCMRPLEIVFTASPTTPQPTGPFVFKADTGTTPPPPPENPCSFDSQKQCVLYKDILNDISPAGLRYYGPTNYDHRISGEINVFDATLVTPYTDAVNAPGQVKLTANRAGTTLFKSGEIMTRPNLHLPPYNSPKQITPFTTNDIQHGYIEARIKLPKCEISDDGLCQNNTAPESYHRGMWPSFWLLPTHDTDWPLNGEIDIFEAYQRTRPINETTAALHFNGNDPRCGNNDCKFVGYHLPSSFSNGPFYNDFHTWGFEWEPDPKSTIGGVILTGYFDNVKAWGPLATDSLPADGPNAYARGFHDPNGGFYYITALALGGGYAGPPSSHLQSASMYVQSVKAYSVGAGTPPPPTDNGVVRVIASTLSDTQCMGASDKFFVDQDTIGQAFTVSTTDCVYKWVPVGMHQVKLSSLTGIPPANSLPGTCTSTLDKPQVQVDANATSEVTATYRYQATNPGAMFGFYVTLGNPYLKVMINNTIPCPEANGNTSCLVKDQAVGSFMTIKGQGTNFCNLKIEASGSVTVSTGSSKCGVVVARPATTTTPGKLNVPGGF